eukprot:15358040-Ditylum_brightwellii.AAC.1
MEYGWRNPVLSSSLICHLLAMPSPYRAHLMLPSPIVTVSCCLDKPELYEIASMNDKEEQQ